MDFWGIPNTVNDFVVFVGCTSSGWAFIFVEIYNGCRYTNLFQCFLYLSFSYIIISIYTQNNIVAFLVEVIYELA